jgi:hypothetical protein
MRYRINGIIKEDYTMKFQKTLILLLAMAPVLHAATDMHQSMLDELGSAYNATFSKGNYLLQPITPEQNQVWQTFLAKLEPYIKTNAPDVVAQLTSLQEISKNSIAELQKNYEDNVRPAYKTEWLKTNGAASFTAFRNQMDLSLLKPLGFNSVSLYFDTLKPRLDTILNTLTIKGNELLRRSSSKHAVVALKKLTKDLQGVVDKTGKDTRNLIDELAAINR